MQFPLFHFIKIQNRLLYKDLITMLSFNILKNFQLVEKMFKYFVISLMSKPFLILQIYGYFLSSLSLTHLLGVP